MAEKRLIKNPLVIVVNFLLAGIVVLFMGLAYGYIFNMGQNWIDFKFPKVFWLSTITIILVSVFLRLALRMYDIDNSKNLKLTLIMSLFFSGLFVYFQLQGWASLKAQGLVLQSSPSVSYLYLLTGLHVAHVVVGIIFLLVAIFRAYKNTGNNVNSLLYFSDQFKRTRLRLLTSYWHTIDFLWLFLFFAFLFHHA